MAVDEVVDDAGQEHEVDEGRDQGEQHLEDEDVGQGEESHGFVADNVPAHCYSQSSYADEYMLIGNHQDGLLPCAAEAREAAAHDCH